MIIIEPSLLLNVEPFCSVVVWNGSRLPCDDIMGYEVRLYNIDSEQGILHVIDKFSAHYIITDADKRQLKLEKAYVQVD